MGLGRQEVGYGRKCKKQRRYPNFNVFSRKIALESSSTKVPRYSVDGFPKMTVVLSWQVLSPSNPGPSRLDSCLAEGVLSGLRACSNVASGSFIGPNGMRLVHAVEAWRFVS